MALLVQKMPGKRNKYSIVMVSLLTSIIMQMSQNVFLMDVLNLTVNGKVNMVLWIVKCSWITLCCRCKISYITVNFSCV